MNLATIERIHSIKTHPNTDVTSLEVAKIKGWPVVIKKGAFRDGELVIFIRIDSIVPKENPAFSFLERQKYRVWNARFKGAPSQGLVMPISLIQVENLEYPMEGDDVTEKLDIKKYEKPLDASMSGEAVGNFPTNLLSVTDEENIQNFPDILHEFHGLDSYLTIKADGSSMTILFFEGKVRVCSRRLEQREGSGFWQIADYYDLPNKLRTLNKPLAIQAEACGGSIQGNPMGLGYRQMFVFNIRELDTGKYYGWREIERTCTALQIPSVRLFQTPFKFNSDVHSIDHLQEMANNVEYMSDTGKLLPGEGIVLRPLEPRYSEILGHQLSVKILNQKYE